jgi:hypothetical protein
MKGMSLDRRTMLRGAGAAIALPLLDAMVPAFVSAAASPVRFAAIYVPNGMILRDFVPPTEGPDFQVPPILQPLAAYRNHMTIVSGLSNVQADSLSDGGGPHTRANVAWLSGARAKRGESDVRAGTTIDQYIAAEIGKDTPLISLEIALEPNSTAGNCEAGYSCTYVNTCSWRTPTRPLPMETNPRVVFERLFGQGGDRATRARQASLNESLLDSVAGDIGRLRRSVGAADRQTVDEYFEAIREVERRIQSTSAAGDADETSSARPLGIPARFEDHATVMFDLIYLAYRSDITRVVAYQMGREQSVRAFPDIGVPEAHHEISHHGNLPDKMAKKAKIDALHATLVAHLVERMAKTNDGDGSLLDHAALLFGASMGDGNVHSAHNLPAVLLGRAGGHLAAGRHVKAKLDTPFMNLGVSLVHKYGVNVDHIGDSTGVLAGI